MRTIAPTPGTRKSVQQDRISEKIVLLQYTKVYQYTIVYQTDFARKKCLEPKFQVSYQTDFFPRNSQFTCKTQEIIFFGAYTLPLNWKFSVFSLLSPEEMSKNRSLSNLIFALTKITSTSRRLQVKDKHLSNLVSFKIPKN